MTTRAKVLFTSTSLAVLGCLATLLFGAWFHLLNSAVALMVLILACAVVGFVSGLALVQPLLRRLYGLEEAAVLMGAGRLQHRIDTATESDEVSRIAHQFNRMAEQIEEQVKALRQLAEENRTLAAEAEQFATLNERQRLARELHDSVSQQLFALSMLASSSVSLFDHDAPSLRNTLVQMAEIATAAQREMRALLLHLRPTDLEGRSFEQATRAFLQAIEERHQVHCTFEQKTETVVESAVEEQLFRVMQEAVANVLKHAEASTVRVVWESSGSVASLSILDDGIGIAEVEQAGDSYGIKTMKERAAALGGRCNVWRRARGTAVEIQIPILEKREREEP